MSDSNPPTYSVDRVPFIPSHKRFSLELVLQPDPKAPVYVRAIPSKDIKGYEIDLDEDKSFNLSSMIGYDNGALIWGRAGFEGSVQNLRIESDYETGNRLLVADSVNAAGDVKSAVINLDDHLDIVEYLDMKSREVMRKLGEKPILSKRSIVLCFDGTSNHFSNQNTNVVKLVELLKKNDPEKQMVYYQTGVGTYAPPGMLTNVGLNIAAKADEGVAWFLYQHVIDGYKYLMQTYKAGDRISIFGFSRGAYTARALAGMIHSHVPFAYQVYEASTEKKPPASSKPKNDKRSPRSEKAATAKESMSISALDYACTTNKLKLNVCLGIFPIDKKSSRPENVDPADFKRAFCITIEIHFLGVWDTVGSVGVRSVRQTSGAFNRKTLPWIEYNPSVHIFRQALALDENRGNFIPSVWDHERTDSNYQSALEVWFKGGHADIGGGAYPPPPGEERGEGLLSMPLLSNIPLRWMIRECLEHSGVYFDPDSMRRYRAIGIIEPRKISGKNTDEQQRLVDHLDEIDIAPKPYVALEESPWTWGILEYLPVPKLDQLGSRTQPSTVYWSTDEAVKDKYIPQATWGISEPSTWPEIEEGVMSSIISEDDQTMKEVRDRLKMEWRKPVGGSWWNPFTWT
ncbi:hypothetical protein FRC07_007436 [Ceratobasidium sp. 392]|nr:hypothetical protein FRC07_007436 [Ceratobasidium sp. 392]